MSQQVHAHVPQVPRPPGLDLRAGGNRTTYVISVVGEIDIAAQDRLAVEIERALWSECPEVVVDLGGCEFLDSTGIHALLTLYSQLELMPDRALLILPAPRHVQRLFRISGVADILPFAD